MRSCRKVFAGGVVAVALFHVASTVLIKGRKARYAWTTLLPLVWLCAVTFTAGWQKVFAADPKLGFLSHVAMIRAKLAAGQLPPGAKTLAGAHRMIFNDRLDATVALVFMAVAVLVIVVSGREWLLVLRHKKPAVLREAPFVPSALVAGD